MATKGVILDCRVPTGLSDAVKARIGRAMDRYLRETLPYALVQPLTLGTYRYREHSGYAPQSGGTTGGYGSALVTTKEERLTNKLGAAQGLLKSLERVDLPQCRTKPLRIVGPETEHLTGRELHFDGVWVVRAELRIGIHKPP